MEDFRIFKRKIYSRLLQWKREENGRTALLIKGARRVGKSTIVKEFARREYKSYMLIDFETQGQVPVSHSENIVNLEKDEN